MDAAGLRLLSHRRGGVARKQRSGSHAIDVEIFAAKVVVVLVAIV